MPDRRRDKPKSRPDLRPGTTREQRERRERAERARRETLRPGGDTVALYGWHTVTAALRNSARQLRLLLATENAARRLADEKVPLALAPQIVRPTAIAERAFAPTNGCSPALPRRWSKVNTTASSSPATSTAAISAAADNTPMPPSAIVPAPCST